MSTCIRIKPEEAAASSQGRGTSEHLHLLCYQDAE
jgi:hypothetical protein